MAESVFLAWSVAERVAKRLGGQEGRWRAIKWDDIEENWRLAVYSEMRARYIEFAREFIPASPLQNEDA